MAANRIRVAKDKAELVKSLVASKDTTGPFQTYADVIVFAAALGAKHKKRIALGEISKRDPDPIPQEHFLSKGYDMLIKLLAITTNKDINIISSNDEHYDTQRIQIFEEYANGGLELLQNEFRGAVDYSERLLLILKHNDFPESFGEFEFDLSKFV
ncbi:DNA phosphorothioation-associated protein 4 [Nostocaceae cyanobacterium CENA357]|uniref:DNA phosphorothioation-associated protein 4 n=1 Tax=Atlanticothrix silvestris CENA357 TaxID=1725252 RepID=A0A8J7L807_9CYAN|nr:DNA phosphorothioation-associated protein 4 [Atlanticothrix silvestris]MBH8555652.1 DNA phosphorothioation-associated protein 4 [Atlanticothrix silvestris CENA357]